MNESLSPLTQTYIDLERLYYVYEKPTYRDILELCLLPFAGQIFQSSGALHIRRAISLYQTSRPVTFFEIGSELPQGIIATDNEATRLVAEPRVVVVTSAGRDIMENMWSHGIYVMGESTLDIVPALRRITVDVKNKSLDNIAGRLGFFDKEMWNDPYGFLDFTESGDSLCFCGDDAHQGDVYAYVVRIEEGQQGAAQSIHYVTGGVSQAIADFLSETDDKELFAFADFRLVVHWESLLSQCHPF